MDRPSAEVEEILAKTIIESSAPLNVFTTLAHHPALLKRLNVMGGLFFVRSEIAPRDREIIILRTAWRASCEYEFGQHWNIGRQAGLTDPEIRALGGGICDWNAHDSILIAAADEISADATLGAQTWSRLRKVCSEAQVIEVIILAGFYRMLAGFLNAAAVQREDGVPGWPE